MEPLKSSTEKLQTPNCAENGHPNKATRCPICMEYNSLTLSEIQSRIVSFAASMAGKSGTGKSKTRNKSHYQRIAKIRWQKNKTSSQSQKTHCLKLRQPK